jgi:hypothetical protein
MSRLIAVFEAGTWSTIEAPEPRPVEPVVKEVIREVPVPMSITTYDDCVAALAGVVAAASRLSFRDQQRVRDVAHAAGSLLSAQTRIGDSDDRKKFEQELHKALAR